MHNFEDEKFVEWFGQKIMAEIAFALLVGAFFANFCIWGFAAIWAFGNIPETKSVVLPFLLGGFGLWSSAWLGTQAMKVP